MRLWLLGGFRAERDGAAVTFTARATRTLVCYLSLRPGRTVTRDYLAGQMWPDRDRGDGRRLLRQEIHRVRSEMGDNWLDTSSETVCFDPGGSTWVDATEFVGLARDGLRCDDPAEARHLLTRAADLWSGPLLAGDVDDMLTDDAQMLARLHIDVLHRLIEAHKAAGALEEALRRARQLVTHEPMREDMHREVMRLSARLGRTTKALEHYSQLEKMLVRDLRVAPSALTRHVRDEIIRARETEPVALPAGSEGTLPLVGRGTERVVALRAIDAAANTDGRTLLIEGAAGAGKTRLAREVADDAAWRTMTVLWAPTAANPGPYEPVVDALGALHPDVIAHIRDQIGPSLTDLLSRLVPAFNVGTPTERARRTRPARPPNFPVGSGHVSEALTRSLLAAAQLRPTVLVVDDAHLATAETWKVLGRLTRRVAGTALSVVIAYRDGEVRDTPETWNQLRHVDTAERTQRIRLGPLSSRAVEELAMIIAPEQTRHGDTHLLAQRVIDGTGGLPQHVLETLRVLRDDPDRALRALDSPSRTSATSQQREAQVERLSPAARRVAEVLAVYGVDCPSTHLSRLCRLEGIDDGDVHRGVAELDAAGLTTTTGDNRISFRHALTRNTVLVMTDPDLRAQIHGHVAQTLEVDRAPAHLIARHYTIADDRPRAHHWHVEAARAAAATYAYPAAALHYRQAHELASTLDLSASTRLQLLLEHGDTLEITGDRQLHAELLDEAEQVATTDDERARIAMSRLIWSIYTGDVDLIEHLAGEAIRLARASGDPALTGRVLHAYGRVLTHRGWAGPALEPLREAVELLTDDPEEQAFARATLGGALRETQRYEEARDEIHRALGAFTALGSDIGIAYTQNAIAALTAESGNFVESTEQFQRARDMARTMGDRHMEAIALSNLGTSLVMCQRVAEASEVFAENIRVFDEDGHWVRSAISRVIHAWMYAAYLGDTDSAALLLDEAEPIARQSNDMRTVGNLLTVRARIATIEGDYDTAVAYLEDGRKLLDEAEDGFVAAQALIQHAEVLMFAGQAGEAAALAEEAVTVTTKAGYEHMAPWAHAIHALTLLQLGRADEATVAVEQTMSDGVLPTAAFCPHVVHLARHAVFAAVDSTAAAAWEATAAAEHVERFLDGFDEEVRQRALQNVPTYAAITAAAEVSQPSTVTVTLTRADVPTGRAVRDDETVEVVWTVHHPSDLTEDDGPPRRRARIRRLLREAAHVGASPTVDDIADVLDVSTSTVRRDLAALRDAGQPVPTRGERQIS